MNIRNKFAVLGAAAALAFAFAPAALSTDLTDVGYIDQAAVGSLPQFQKANAEIAQYKAQLDQQFSAASKNAKSDADRARIAQQFQKRFLDEQRRVLGPLFARAQTAIAQVSSNKGISVVVDKRIVIYGGQNITASVISLIQSPGPVVPPVNTPPPSEIGFVDQLQIDQVAKIKQANDVFLKFANDQKQQTETQLAKAKTPAEREQIVKTYQSTINGEQKKVLQPLVDETKRAMADIAKKKNLILVIDRSDVIYGGTDITADVQNALK